MHPQGLLSRGESLPAFPATAYPQRRDPRRDWTKDLPDTDHVRFFLGIDWAHSILGPLDGWSPLLRSLTQSVLVDPRSACLWWGPDMVAIYNDAYKWRAGVNHPKLMGKPFKEGYPPEMWEELKPYFDQVRKTGIGSEFKRLDPIIIERHGWREETYFTASFVPVGDAPTNRPDGFYNSLFEITDLQIAERRTTMLNRMAAAQDITATTVWPLILATLETNPRDIPMAILYELDTSGDTDIMWLRGQLGLPSWHKLLVDGVDLDSSEGMIPDCRAASLETRIIDYDDRFSCVVWRGHGAPSQKIAILPLFKRHRTFGYLIVGTNPLRPHDDVGKRFLADMRRMVTAVIETATIAKESRARELSLQLDLEESDLKLRHLLEHTQVGLVHMDRDGKYLWGNERYMELHGLPPDSKPDKAAVFAVYSDEDRPKAEQAWKDLQAGADRICVELGLNTLYTTPLGNQEHGHLQVMAFPYKEQGLTKGIMAAITDISHLKWAQDFQARLAAEAREAKRQQEAFIDVVSHEMRNPLSAIMHCADEITKSLEECRAKQGSDVALPEACESFLRENVNAAQIIMQCVNHQKRIIDDVLTLSRLDSMLLSITPSPIRPMKLINTVVGIFEAELKSSQISYAVTPDPTLTNLQVDQVYLDPSRVTQIFINLITNAIKFVKPSSHPNISISYGAATSDPRSLFPDDFHWAQRDTDSADMTDGADWGDGEALYLTFQITDTGIGMAETEIQKIFARFRQASIRTHVEYGGSGLGLFISKELTEKQGGEIGVKSSPGEGSTFGFYIRTKRVPVQEKKALAKGAKLGLGGLPAPKVGETSTLQVLLVEDNVVNQQVLLRQLKKAGLSVDIANQGEEALAWLEKKRYDVVLMDLEMPVMDGLTAMREIRRRQSRGEIVKASPKGRGREGDTGEECSWRKDSAVSSKPAGKPSDHLPIIAVTANVRQEQIDTAIEAGADTVMQKPFKAVDLVRMMKGMVPQIMTPGTEPSTPGLLAPMNGLLS